MYETCLWDRGVVLDYKALDFFEPFFLLVNYNISLCFIVDIYILLGIFT